MVIWMVIWMVIFVGIHVFVFFFRCFTSKRVIVLQTQTMRYHKANPLELPYICICIHIFSMNYTSNMEVIVLLFWPSSSKKDIKRTPT